MQFKFSDANVIQCDGDDGDVMVMMVTVMMMMSSPLRSRRSRAPTDTDVHAPEGLNLLGRGRQVGGHSLDSREWVISSDDLKRPCQREGVVERSSCV